MPTTKDMSRWYDGNGDYKFLRADDEYSVDKLAEKMEGAALLSVDENAAGTKVSTHFDLTGASAGQVPTVNAAGTSMEWGNPIGIQYTTTAPTAANTDGLKFVVLTSEPETKYAGWFYIITEA